jgi:hypothetical protein
LEGSDSMAAKPKKPKARKADNRQFPADPEAMLQEFLALIEDIGPDGFDDEEFSAEELIEDVLSGSFEGDDDLEEVLGELESVLADLRIETNGGSRPARQESRQVRDWLAQRLEDPKIDGSALLALGHTFSRADFDPGPAFGTILARRFGQATQVAESSDPTDLLDDVIAEVGDDPFELFDTISRFARFMPGGYRSASAEILASSDNMTLREAALGYLLESDDQTAETVARVLRQSAAGAAISASLVAKLVRMRGLLPPKRHAMLDATIKALRQKAAAPEPAPAVKIVKLAASTCDGSGGQSLIAHVVVGGEHVLLSMMIKNGQGVSECVILGDMTKRQLENLLSSSAAQNDMQFVPIASELFKRRLAAAVADNHASGRPVPYGLVALMERTGLAELHPEPLMAEALFDDMISGSLFDASFPEALDNAARALDAAGIMESWFEAGEAVDTLLDKVKSHKRRLEVLLRDYLPGRRRFWIEQCAWTAAVLKQKPPKKQQSWFHLALLGKQLCTDQPMSESPLMQFIAQASIKAYLLQ